MIFRAPRLPELRDREGFENADGRLNLLLFRLWPAKIAS